MGVVTPVLCTCQFLPELVVLIIEPLKLAAQPLLTSVKKSLRKDSFVGD